MPVSSMQGTSPSCCSTRWRSASCSTLHMLRPKSTRTTTHSPGALGCVSHVGGGGGGREHVSVWVWVHMWVRAQVWVCTWACACVGVGTGAGVGVGALVGARVCRAMCGLRGSFVQWDGDAVVCMQQSGHLRPMFLEAEHEGCIMCSASCHNHHCSSTASQMLTVRLILVACLESIHILPCLYV